MAWDDEVDTLDEVWHEEYGSSKTEIRIVPTIGLVAHEYCTPIPMVMKLPFRFFLGLVKAHNDKVKRENEAYKKSERDAKRGR